MQDTYQSGDTVRIGFTDSCLDGRSAKVIGGGQGQYILLLDVPYGKPGFGIVSGVSLPVGCLFEKTNACTLLSLSRRK